MIEDLENAITEALVIFCSECEEPEIRYYDTKYEMATHLSEERWSTSKKGKPICPECSE